MQWQYCSHWGLSEAWLLLIKFVIVWKFSPPTCSVHFIIYWIIPNSNFSFSYRCRNAMVLCKHCVFQFISKIFHGKNSLPPITSLLSTVSPSVMAFVPQLLTPSLGWWLPRHLYFQNNAVLNSNITQPVTFLTSTRDY